MVGNSCALVISILLMLLGSCPMVSCEEDTYKSLLELSPNSPDFLDRDLTDSKRFSDIDYDSFVGLMGRRSAARDMDDVFVGLLGRRSPEALPRPWKNGLNRQPARGFFIHKGRLRFQRGVQGGSYFPPFNNRVY